VQMLRLHGPLLQLLHVVCVDGRLKGSVHALGGPAVGRHACNAGTRALGRPDACATQSLCIVAVWCCLLLVGFLHSDSVHCSCSAPHHVGGNL
jgi:hypothetical protein